MKSPPSKIPPLLFDKFSLSARQALQIGNARDFVTDMIIADLSARLSTIKRTFSHALIMGPNAAHLPETLSLNDKKIAFQRASTMIESKDFLRLNPETFRAPRNDYDLIVSLFDMTVTNDVPAFLHSVLEHLTPDGLFFAAFIGGRSLKELRTAWLEADSIHINGAVARVAPFIDTKTAGRLVQNAGFALPVADTEAHTIRYASPLALMKELRSFGASNPLLDRNAQMVTKSHLASVCSFYEKIAGDSDGRVSATLEIIWMVGWAPHPDQQQPARSGIAKTLPGKIRKKY